MSATNNFQEPDAIDVHDAKNEIKKRIHDGKVKFNGTPIRFITENSIKHVATFESVLSYLKRAIAKRSEENNEPMPANPWPGDDGTLDAFAKDLRFDFTPTFRAKVFKFSIDRFKSSLPFLYVKPQDHLPRDEHVERIYEGIIHHHCVRGCDTRLNEALIMKEYAEVEYAEEASMEGNMCLFGFMSEGKYYLVSKYPEPSVVEDTETESEEE
ncbi:hypothetical protein CC86DRAFT_400420 [Ophiobolus disseminans]|uniref:Uncharacterized protein n=1 Tax=Ophiobolus disseminans TaxID=1469910 RepID=A0A6A7AN03_9PLEO|nr:hypothetical protein CC86DRAFT_400420 [Ophiobolus disseminans]